MFLTRIRMFLGPTQFRELQKPEKQKKVFMHYVVSHYQWATLAQQGSMESTNVWVATRTSVEPIEIFTSKDSFTHLSCLARNSKTRRNFILLFKVLLNNTFSVLYLTLYIIRQTSKPFTLPSSHSRVGSWIPLETHFP